MKIITKSDQETQEIAQKYAQTLKSGDVLVLKGDLGAGKTTFTKGIGHFFGIETPITSPTFIGMQLYEIQNHAGIQTLCHIDAYRFRSKEDAVSAGLTDYVGKPGVVTIIEWPEQLFGLFEMPYQLIEFYHEDEMSRLIVLPDPPAGGVVSR